MSLRPRLVAVCAEWDRDSGGNASLLGKPHANGRAHPFSGLERQGATPAQHVADQAEEVLLLGHFVDNFHVGPPALKQIGSSHLPFPPGCPSYHHALGHRAHFRVITHRAATADRSPAPTGMSNRPSRPANTNVFTWG